MMKIKLKDVFYYFQGHIRYKLYYSKSFNFLVGKHIKEQYIYRLNVMNKDCLFNGYCIKCGCSTPELQFSSKPCDGNCYTKMLNKKDWNNKKKKECINIVLK